MISKHGTGIALGLIIISGSMALSQALGESRIINGQVADMATYPFLVSIRKYENGDVSQCGGSVLTPRVVLTAAHCVAPREDTGEPEGTPYNAINNFYLPLVVTAADVPVGDPHSGNIPATSLVPTKAVVTSAGWNGAAQGGYDLALLLLEDDLVDVETVTLPAAGTTYTAGEAFNLAGWGNTSPTGIEFPATLMEATVNYVPRNSCYDQIVEYAGTAPLSKGLALESTWMCAQGAQVDGFYTDACQGDSGSPLSIIDDNGDATVVGIVSWGFACGSEVPGIYSNVEYFTPWIEQWLSVWEKKGLVSEHT